MAPPPLLSSMDFSRAFGSEFPVFRTEGGHTQRIPVHPLLGLQLDGFPGRIQRPRDFKWGRLAGNTGHRPRQAVVGYRRCRDRGLLPAGNRAPHPDGSAASGTKSPPRMNCFAQNSRRSGSLEARSQHVDIVIQLSSQVTGFPCLALGFEDAGQRVNLGCHGSRDRSAHCSRFRGMWVGASLPNLIAQELDRTLVMRLGFLLRPVYQSSQPQPHDPRASAKYRRTLGSVGNSRYSSSNRTIDRR